MGDLIRLADRLAAVVQPVAPVALPPLPRSFYFDLSCPLAYLDGDRVERILGSTQWRPAPSMRAGGPVIDSLALQQRAEHRAEVQRLPLNWPEGWGRDCRGLHRAAAYAAHQGAGGGFAMAALRLAFSGGFDPADEFVLEEAAAAAALPVDACLAAADDAQWDMALAANRRELTASGLRHAPAIRVGTEWFTGEHAIADARRAAFRAPRRAEFGTSAAS